MSLITTVLPLNSITPMPQLTFPSSTSNIKQFQELSESLNKILLWLQRRNKKFLVAGTEVGLCVNKDS